MLLKIKYTFLLFLFVFAFTYKASSSTIEHQIDSLKQLLSATELSDTTKPILLFDLSRKEYNLQHYPEAIDYANQALVIFKNENNLEKESKTLEFLGIYYAEFSDYDNSIKYLLASLKIAEELQDLKAINSRNFNIGTTFAEAGSNKKGIEFLKKAISYYQQDATKNIAYLVAGHTNLGVAYNGMNMLDSAMFHYQKAATIAKEENVTNQIGGPLLNIGEIHLKRERIQEALEYYQLALASFESSDDIRGIWHTNFGIASIYSKQRKIPEAIFLLEKSIVHYKETNDLNYLGKSLAVLSTIYEDQANYDLALSYKNQLLEVNDSISKSEIINKIADMELQYKIEKLQKENEIELQLLNQQKKISTLRWYIATGILLIIIILIITLYNRNQTQKKLVETRLINTQLEQNKLKSELYFRNTELENFALHIVQKNDFLTDIKQKFKQLRTNASDKNADEIQKLSIKINQSLRINKELEKFRERVDDVNSHFFNLLEERYPDLTEKEKRLCALLKLNLSSKEIATLNNITEGAVTMARYRLRKRIGMETDENLTEFFQKLA